MTREEKQEAIENLKDALAGVKTLYLADIAGLDATQTSNLRRACFKENIKLQVVKNTLLAKAMEASDHDFGELTGILKGNTSLMFSETGNAPAKVIKTFRKKSEKPILKGASVTGTILEHGRDRKILVYKKKRRKGYQRKNGHRQWFTEIEFNTIKAGKTQSNQEKIISTESILEEEE